MHGEQASIGRRGLRTVGRVLTWPVRRWRIIALMLAGLFLAYYVFGYVMVWRLEQQKDALREAGIPLQFSEMDIPEPSYAYNAAIPYRHAYARIVRNEPDWLQGQFLDAFVRRLKDSGGPACAVESASASNGKPPLDAEELANLEAYFEALEPAYELIVEAQRWPSCLFRDYRHLDDFGEAWAVVPPHLFFDQMTMSELARYINHRARWEEYQGNKEDAWLWAIRGLRLANGMTDDPDVTIGFSRSAYLGIAFAYLRSLVSESGIPEQLRGEIVKELNVLEGTEVYAYYTNGGICGELNVVESTMNYWNRPFAALNCAKYLEVGRRVISILDMESRKQRLAAFNELEEEISELGMFYSSRWEAGGTYHWIEYSSLIVLGRDVAGKTLANAELCRISLALKDYRRDHGAYPASLEALAPEYLGSIPMDPFSGDPYVYERDETGFRIYSVGLNQADDEGLAGGGKDGDIVWCAQ